MRPGAIPPTLPTLLHRREPGSRHALRRRAPQTGGARAAGEQYAGGRPATEGKTLRVYEAPEANQGVAAGLTHFFVIDNSTLAKYEIRPDAWSTGGCGARERTDSPHEQLPGRRGPHPVRQLQLPADADGLVNRSVRSRLARPRLESQPRDARRGFADLVRPVSHRLDRRLLALRQERRRAVQGPLVLERRHVRCSSGGGPAAGCCPRARWSGWRRTPRLAARSDRTAGSTCSATTARAVRRRQAGDGPVLVHIATIAIETEGQAFSWAKNGARVIYTIDRRKHLVRTIEIPPVVVKDASVRRFR